MGAVMSETPVLKMTAAAFARIREAVLTPCGREHKIYVELGRTGPGYTLSHLHIPRAEDYVLRTPVYVHLRPEWMMRTLLTYADGDAEGVLEIHSHPFCERASFSATDDQFIDGVREDFQRKKPGSAFLRMVVGHAPDGFSIEVYDEHQDGFRSIPAIVVVDKGGAERIRSFSAGTVEESVLPQLAYERVACVRTPAEHQRIGAAHAVVVGAGGTGWLAAQLLACLGVGALTLVDSDRVEDVNLNRLVGVTRDEIANHALKVDCLARLLTEHDPARRVTAIGRAFPNDAAVAAIARADFVVCCVDDPLARLAVQRVCARHLAPALDVGSSIYLNPDRTREQERHAHAWLYVPGGACWLHMGLREQGLASESLHEARRAMGYVVGDGRQSPGSVQTLNATIVSLGLSMLEAYVMGRRPAHNVIFYEERVEPNVTIKLRQFHVSADAVCPLCGDDGVCGLGGNPYAETELAATPITAPASDDQKSGDDVSVGQPVGSGVEFNV